jgi:hypothetical protein
MDFDYAAIVNDLRLLREGGVPIAAFHPDNFRTNPPLSEEAVRQFQSEHGVVLPPSHRGFLIQVGNGGAGPHGGLFRLGEMDDGWESRIWQEGNGFIGLLSRPFPHTEPWNDLVGMPVFDESKDGDREWERAYEAFEDKYWSPEQVNGAIPICHLGCARRQWLVVNGPEAGNVWCDDRVDHLGLHPLQFADSRRISFLDWYRTWLDDAVARLKRVKRALGYR